MARGVDAYSVSSHLRAGNMLGGTHIVIWPRHISIHPRARAKLSVVLTCLTRDDDAHRSHSSNPPNMLSVEMRISYITYVVECEAHDADGINGDEAQYPPFMLSLCVRRVRGSQRVVFCVSYPGIESPASMSSHSHRIPEKHEVDTGDIREHDTDDAAISATIITIHPRLLLKQVKRLDGCIWIDSGDCQTHTNSSARRD